LIDQTKNFEKSQYSEQSIKSWQSSQSYKFIDLTVFTLFLS